MFICSGILAKLTEEQINQFLAVVSEELKVVRDEASMISTLQLLPPNLWLNLSEAARLRVENKLLRSIQEGEAYVDSRHPKGALGTWARDFLPHFSNKDEIARVIVEKLEDNDADDRRYVLRYFFGVLPLVVLNSWYAQRCIDAICKAVRDGEEEAIQGLTRLIRSYPDRWQKAFVTKLKNLTDANSPAVYLDDGTPFLKSEEADIPF